MVENKKHKDSRFYLPSSISSNPEKKRVFDYMFFAVLVIILICLLLWKFVLKPINETHFENTIDQVLEQHQNAVNQYTSSMTQLLKNITEAEATKTLLIELNTKPQDDNKSLNAIQQLIFSSIPDAKSVEIYFPGQAQQEKDDGGEISFIKLNMINQAERNKTVLPEAAKSKTKSEWELHWVAAFDNRNNKPQESKLPPIAILHIVTTMQGVELALSGNDPSLAQLQLLQTIEKQRELLFFEKGTGASGQTKSLDISNSHWQVAIQPASAMRKKLYYVPIWLIALFLLLSITTIFSAYKLAQQKSRQVKSGYKTLDKPIEANVEANKATTSNENKEEFGELDDPLYMADQQLIVDETDMDLVNASHQKKVHGDTQDSDKSSSHSSSLSQDVLQNFSNHIFRSYDIRGIYEKELNLELTEAIGKAVATEALEKGEKSLIIGYDARTHSPILYESLKKGVLSTGCNIIFCGLVPTPLLNFATIFSDQTNSGIIITASHNHKSYNGFKIILDEHTLTDSDIQLLKQRILDSNFTLGKQLGEVSEVDYSEDYTDTVISDIAINSDLRIVIDASNGAASELAPRLFTELGCHVIPLFCEFDGEFPNHDPDPSIDTNLSSLITTVASEKADLGIALDGDGDRLVIVTSSGKIIWPDILLMLFAKDVVSRNPGCDIVFDVKSTRQLNQVISSYGGRPVMWKTGHSNIKAKMKETEALLGGEFSGHIFFKERWFGFDDGIYAAARLLEIMSLREQSIDEMLTSMPKIISTPEIKIPIAENLKFHLVEALIKKGHFNGGEKNTTDGLRIDFDMGWGLIRPSNTSAALTLRFEASDEEAVIELKNLFKREISALDGNLPLDF